MKPIIKSEISNDDKLDYGEGFVIIEEYLEEEFDIAPVFSRDASEDGACEDNLSRHVNGTRLNNQEFICKSENIEKPPEAILSDATEQEVLKQEDDFMLPEDHKQLLQEFQSSSPSKTANKGKKSWSPKHSLNDDTAFKRKSLCEYVGECGYLEPTRSEVKKGLCKIKDKIYLTQEEIRLYCNVVEYRMRNEKAKIHPCCCCNYKSRKIALLKRHLLSHSFTKRFKCPECDFESNFKSKIKEHSVVHSGLRPFKCSYCNYSVKFQSNLLKHEQTHLENKQKRIFKDATCNDSSLSLNVYRTSKRKQKFICQSDTFEKQTEAILPDVTEQQGEELTRSKVKECLPEFEDKIYLTKEEIRRYSDIVEYRSKKEKVKIHPCCCCNYKSGKLALIKRHLLSHLFTKRFKCPECSYEANFKSNMKEHSAIHSDLRPFKCSYCNFSSKLRSNLTKHERTHLKKKIINKIKK